MPTKHQITALPIISLLVSATLWGVIWYPLRLLEQGGLSGSWQALVLYSAATLLFLLYWPRLLHAYRTAPFSLTVMALASGWCNLAFMLAVLYGEVVRAMLLFYLSPLWAVLLGWLLLSERLAREGVLVLVVAISGAVVMLWDPSMGYPWPASGADWLALSSGAAFAVMNVEVRRLQSVEVQAKTMLSWIGCIVVALAAILFIGDPVPDVEVSVWGWAVLLGVLGITVMTLAVQYGVTHMPIQRSAVILLFEIVVGAISSQLLTDEVIEWQEWVGGAMIIAAAYLTAHREMRS